MIIRTLTVLVSCCLLFSCSGGGGSGGPPVLPPAKTSPKIFSSYNPNLNADMAPGWARSMDMSGVSFNDTRTATLVTPRHVVMAKHYSRGPADAVIFHDRSGQRIARKLVAFAPAAGDVMVGLLDEPVPSAYHPYALPSTDSDASALVGLPVIVSDKERNLFVHLVAGVGSGKIAFKQDERDLYGWGKNLISGDSGNPSFLIVGKQLVLIETHTTGGPGAGPYYGESGVQASVKAAVRKLDPAYSIRTVRVP